MWYYAREGKTFGPYEKLELIERARRGDFSPDDYVWHPDFGSQWRLARDVEGIFEFPGMGRLVGGTGGLTPNAELTRRARESLRGNWPAAVGATLVFDVLLMLAVATQWAAEKAGIWWAGVIQIIFTPVLIVGYLRFHSRLIHEHTADLAELFRGFRSWVSAAVAGLLVDVFMLLWALLFLVPLGLLTAFLGPALPHPWESPPVGTVFLLLLIALIGYLIWVTLRYFMTFPAIADDPSIGPLEAIRRSVRLVRRRYWKLLCFNLRYLPWFLSGLLPCGIGLLWVLPYYYAGIMHFYNDLKAPPD